MSKDKIELTFEDYAAKLESRREKDKEYYRAYYINNKERILSRIRGNYREKRELEDKLVVYRSKGLINMKEVKFVKPEELSVII